MQTVNIHEAKTRLSELIAKAVAGQPFVIAKAGKPLVEVKAIQPVPPKTIRRIGFLKGAFPVPEDFDAMNDEIAEMFYGDHDD